MNLLFKFIEFCKKTNKNYSKFIEELRKNGFKTHANLLNTFAFIMVMILIILGSSALIGLCVLFVFYPLILIVVLPLLFVVTPVLIYKDARRKLHAKKNSGDDYDSRLKTAYRGRDKFSY